MSQKVTANCMKKGKRIIYVEGYDHYSHRRRVKITFMLNESENECLRDLMSVLHVSNMSAFIRSQIFRAYRDLTPEQKQQLTDVATWRASERRCDK